MSNNYKRKLRSYKPNKDTQVEVKKEEEEDEETAKEEVEEESRQLPQTPSPVDDIQPFFPPSPFGRKRQQPAGDRFIPSRERDIVRDFQVHSDPNKRYSTDLSTEPILSESSRRIHAFFRAEILNDPTAADEYISPERNTQRILYYQSNSNATVHHSEPSETESLGVESSLDSPTPHAPRFHTSVISEAGRRILSSTSHLERPINQAPIKTLDAPNLQDDFYLNLIDWGTNDFVAVGLNHAVYLWDAGTSRVTKLHEFVDTVTSVNWSQAGSLLAIGTSSGHSFLYDTATTRCIRAWHNHVSRIGTIAWRSNILSTGGRDRKIYHHDVRSPNAFFRKLSGHRHEVCGLKWNPEGTMLASGGNDNKLLVWDSHQDKVSHCFSEHQAAVKAISWSPHKRGILASGGGTADMTIKLWNTISGQMNASYHVGSQVCNLLWSKKTDEIVSTHGYSQDGAASSNSVILWKADKMKKLASLSGHNSRVLYMALSHDGSTVVTGAGDETIKFWDLFSLVKTTKPIETDERKGCLR
ncbi:fizzy-related protein [Choanephora cucurbitarum]|nr:fizzy-related protein [Choanephora cucurbitarum]